MMAISRLNSTTTMSSTYITSMATASQGTWASQKRVWSKLPTIMASMVTIVRGTLEKKGRASSEAAIAAPGGRRRQWQKGWASSA